MKANKLTPNLEVRDIKNTVEFYTTKLGFKLVMAVPESQDGIDQELANDKAYVYALMQKDQVELMFQRSDSFKEDVVFAKGLPIGASVSFYMEMEGIKELHAELSSQGLEVTELKMAWYGMREFYLKDLNGYLLGFGEKAE
ncbi:VOC family protein [Sunxiuqinia elliptica]|uniref:Putative glyoxalase superfamily protein PhnB n=1 Tax=Sunxiuqinia elliptica TaxID=655355 RepID=A0A4R6GY90_9BACT|nr:VOC family protein [Sunxiuqinia elliptica]TDN99804.1 putative glyoxalase superfamily protein PhnB [Sunxiuqinia elliptica]TDO56996.1 putative glyoxalase superfamily protein PhnB [Sunxiuqinia elliptica]